MTAFSKIGNKKYNKRNRKDGRQSKPADPGAAFEKAGFTQIDWNKHSYSMGEGLPSFTVQPGIVGFKAGLVAHCGQTEILFGYGTSPAEIASVLDDIIYDDLTAMEVTSVE